MSKKNPKEYRKCVYVGRENGKQKTINVRAKSQQELNAKVNALKAEIQRGKDVYIKAYFDVWADLWLQQVKIPSGIGKKTIEEYKGAIAHLNREFKGVELKDIRLLDFQIFLNSLALENPNTGKPASKKLLKDIKSTAKGIFNYAIGNNISGVTNFFDSVQISKSAPTQKRRSLTEEEQNWVIETEHRAQLPAMLMMFSGLRRGEALALCWEDIDIENRLINVTKSVSFDENKALIKEGGKTVNAVRIVPIPQILVDFLEDYKEKNSIYSGHVCVTEKNKMHTKSSFRRLWDSYLLELNLKYGYGGKINKHDPRLKAVELPLKIPKLTPHYLRHTYATLLYLQNINMVDAKQYLGHSDIQTTINIYTDLKNFNKLQLSEEYRNKLKTDYSIKK